MKLLHLDSSIMGEGSASRAISGAVVERLRETDPSLDVTYRDLAAEPIPHMTLDAFLELESGEDVQQFLDADVVVIGVGFYNFSIPSQLKAWVDRIAVKGKTFTYGETGPVGLSAGKRVIIALARGNVYGEGITLCGVRACRNAPALDLQLRRRGRRSHRCRRARARRGGASYGDRWCARTSPPDVTIFHRRELLTRVNGGAKVGQRGGVKAGHLRPVLTI
ncbi:FMN-dependent NADH-azoreductase [Sphingomonas sp. H160509]|uniref:FMN-dependent NADH-azoreductase n=1 Tax=Sphingomonas sp. H160509 TaxID=2955313 RepID=UPI0031590935